jgi:transcription elongation factor Elf1
MLEFTRFTCPHCWSEVEIPVDGAEGTQEYVEDCSVCCRPIRLRVRVGANGALGDVEASREND